MAKVNELKSSFSSSRKTSNKPSADDIERISAKVETQTQTPAPVVPELIKTSMDFPAQLYKDMKMKLIDTRQNMKDYIVELITKDLYGK